MGGDGQTARNGAKADECGGQEAGQNTWLRGARDAASDQANEDDCS